MAALSHSVRLETLGRVRFRGFTVMTYEPVGVICHYAVVRTLARGLTRPSHLVFGKLR